MPLALPKRAIAPANGLPRQATSRATAINNRRALKKFVLQFSFYTASNWTAPRNVARIKVKGRGVDGQGGYTTGGPYYIVVASTTLFRHDGGSELVNSNGNRIEGYGPGAWCDNAVAMTDHAIYSSYQTCYYPNQFDDTTVHPETTGDPTVAFGMVFPGGEGVNATAIDRPNLPVQPNTRYEFPLPLGGSLELTYWA